MDGEATKPVTAAVRAKWGRTFFVSILGAWLLVAPKPVQAADQAGLCSKVHPLIGGGYSTVLGTYAEGGIRCPADPWTLQLGMRYTQLAQATNPFVILSYDTALSPEWHLSVTGSHREHIGDYELERLPEVTVRWAPSLPQSFIIPTIDVSAGWINVIEPPITQTSRAGTVLTLSTRPVPVSQVTLSSTYVLGEYYYGTGQTSNYWTGTVTAYLPLSPSMAETWTYVHQEGFGVSPLAYDSVSYDNFVFGQFTVTFDTAVSLTLGAQFDINVPAYPQPVRTLTLAYNKVSEGWTIGVGYYYPTNTWYPFASAPL